jgi:hypothetical protein
MFARATGLGSWPCTPVIVLRLREARNPPVYSMAVAQILKRS